MPDEPALLHSFSPRAWGWSDLDVKQVKPHPVFPTPWGWSYGVHQSADAEAVFPTGVGMVRYAVREFRLHRGFPHERGDGPHQATMQEIEQKFSPHAWGW